METEQYNPEESWGDIISHWKKFKHDKWQSQNLEQDKKAFLRRATTRDKFDKLVAEIETLTSDSRGYLGSLAAFIKEHLPAGVVEPYPALTPEPVAQSVVVTPTDPDLDGFFDEMWGMWPHPSEFKGKPSRGKTALAGRLSRSSKDEIRKVCNWYAKRCARPDADPRFFFNFANFFDDDEKFDEALDRADSAPTAADLVAWGMVKKLYPNYPAKEADFSGGGAMEIWRYHIPPQCRVAFLMSVKQFAFEQRQRWMYGVHGKEAEDRNAVEAFTHGIKAHIQSWQAVAYDEYAERIGPAIALTIQHHFRSDWSKSMLPGGANDLRWVGHIIGMMNRKECVAGDFAQVEEYRRILLTNYVARFVAEEIGACKQQTAERPRWPVEPSEWVLEHRPTIREDRSVARCPNWHKIRKVVNNVLLEVAYKTGQLPRPVVDSVVSVELRPGDPRQVEAAAGVAR